MLLPSSNRPLSRAAFLAALESALQAKPGSVPDSALFLLRIDRFGGLSSALGYKKTDQVIAAAGQLFADALRAADLIANYDLGTFAIWMPQASQRVEVLQLANRLGRATNIEVQGHKVPLTFSVACVLYPAHGETVEQLLRRAHAALSLAKQSGGNQVTLAQNQELEPLAKANDWAMQNTLSKAIETSALTLSYQPVVDLKTQQWVAVEALLRPKIRELAGVSTDLIMDIAETLPILGELTRWGLQEACTAAAQWHEKTGRWLPVAVNLPPQALASSSLVYWVSLALAQSSLPGHYLTLELTERSLVNSDGLTQLRLGQLRALDCILAIDDFGVGQAALAQLVNLPIGKVKFDRSLIANLGRDPKVAVMMKHLLAMTTELGLEAVAEGVETSEQASLLQSLGCQYAQGYFFSVPLTSAQIGQGLIENHLVIG